MTRAAAAAASCHPIDPQRPTGQAARLSGRFIARIQLFTALPTSTGNALGGLPRFARRSGTLDLAIQREHLDLVNLNKNTV